MIAMKKRSLPPAAPRRVRSICLGLALAALCMASHAQNAGTEPKAEPRTPQQQADTNQPNDGSDYIAAWTVMGDICEDKYPQMKSAVEEFWRKRDAATRDRVATMRKAPGFPAKLEKFRKSLGARKDEILEQCGRMFTGGGAH